jgi:hypothetical protein
MIKNTATRGSCWPSGALHFPPEGVEEETRGPMDRWSANHLVGCRVIHRTYTINNTDLQTAY